MPMFLGLPGYIKKLIVFIDLFEKVEAEVKEEVQL